MARIRTIKPEFFTSETLANFSVDTRLTFIGIWTYVDDYGVGILNEKLIAAALYPLEDDPSRALRRVSGALRDLSSVDILSLYVVGNKKYLRVVNWEEHQTISHRSKPKFPPHDDPRARAITWEEFCQGDVNVTNMRESSGGLQSLAGGLPEGSPLNREQGTGNREQGKTHVASGLATAGGAVVCAEPVAPDKITTPRATRKRTEGTPEFNEFWAIYPRDAGKSTAWEKWNKAICGGEDPDRIIEAARRHREYHQWRGTDIDKIPHASTWLNQKRYNDTSEYEVMRRWNMERNISMESRAPVDRRVEETLNKRTGDTSRPSVFATALFPGNSKEIQA